METLKMNRQDIINRIKKLEIDLNFADTWQELIAIKLSIKNLKRMLKG